MLRCFGSEKPQRNATSPTAKSVPERSCRARFNSLGEHPATTKYDPHDLLASIYNYLGINPKKENLDLAGRPIVLSRGEPIPGLV